MKKAPRASSAGAESKFFLDYNTAEKDHFKGLAKDIQDEHSPLYHCAIFLRAELARLTSFIRSRGPLSQDVRYEVARLEQLGLTYDQAVRLGRLSLARFAAEPLAWRAMVARTRPYCEAAEFTERWLRVEDDGSERWFDDGTRVLFQIPALRVHTFRDNEGVLVDQTITTNIEDCVGPATVYTCVRPRGEGWEVYDDRKDRITIWRRPAGEAS